MQNSFWFHICRHMYWTDWGKNPKIEKANMDGTSRFTLVENGLYWPNALAIDYHGNRLYWADASLNKIESCDLFGANRRIVYQGENIQPFGLAFSEGYVYWSDTISQSIQKLNTKTGVSVQFVKHLSPRPYGVYMHDPGTYKKGRPKIAFFVYYELQIKPDFHVFFFFYLFLVATLCDDQNAGCSHLCLIRHNGYTCACPSGYKLQFDRKTCKRGTDKCPSLH